MTPLLLDIIVKATGVLALAAAADALLRRRGSAAARHLVWTMGIAALLALPVASIALPRWTVPLPVGTAAAATTSTWTPTRAIEGHPSAVAGRPKDGAIPVTSRTTNVTRDQSSGWETSAVVVGILASLYLAGVLLLLVRLIVEPFGLRRLARGSSVVADPAWQALLETGQCELDIRGDVRLLRSGREIMPLTFGTLEPTIVLPASSTGWADDRRRAVVLHELAHIARRDCSAQRMTALACAGYWPHPGVWWAARRLRIERELACDDRVLAAGAGPREYAGHLLELAHSLGSAPAPATALGMARPGQLETRLLAVLDAARNRAPLGRRGRLIALTLALALAIPLAVLRAAIVPRDSYIARSAGGAGSTDPDYASAVLTGEASSQPSGLSGTWDLRLTRDPETAQITVHTEHGTHGRTIRVDQLPIPATQISAASANVNVPFRREAGTFNVEGICRRGVCGGTFTFEPSEAFAAELTKRGFARPTPEQQMSLAIADVGTAFLDDLSKNGYAKPDLPDLIRAAQHGVGPDYLRQMSALGYRAGSLDALVRLRDHGIDPQYIHGMADNGFAKLSIDDLVTARDHGVDPEYIKGMRELGFRQPDLKSLIDARNHGIDPEYVHGMEAHGYRLTLDEALVTRNHGVDPEYVEGMAALGYKGLTVDTLVQARNHGVDPEYIRSIADLGYKNEPLETLIRMRDHGVDAAYVRRVQQKGLGHLSVDELIQRRDHGMDDPDAAARAIVYHAQSLWRSIVTWMQS